MKKFIQCNRLCSANIWWRLQLAVAVSRLLQIVFFANSSINPIMCCEWWNKRTFLSCHSTFLSSFLLLTDMNSPAFFCYQSQGRAEATRWDFLKEMGHLSKHFFLLNLITFHFGKFSLGEMFFVWTFFRVLLWRWRDEDEIMSNFRSLEIVQLHRSCRVNRLWCCVSCWLAISSELKKF